MKRPDRPQCDALTTRGVLRQLTKEVMSIERAVREAAKEKLPTVNG
jgi:hypothetical protein